MASTNQAGSAPVFTADRIAELLADPERPPLLPTAEQRAVIEHPLAGSALVIAGAGSGKTETMANRVVWLVANGLVEPDRVLGLTFTRKAAGELRERITTRLENFSARLGDAAELGRLSARESERAHELARLLGDGLDLPEVSTYNAFASGVLQEFGVAAGIPPGAVVIDEATAWRVARETILSSDDPDLVTSSLRTPELVRHVLAIDHAVADNLTSFDRVEQIVGEFARVIELPYNEKDTVGGADGKNYADVAKAVANVAETPLLTRLAREFAAAKQRRGLIEFSDQLALATRTLEGSPDAVAVLRRRHAAVLLDEVQDTSVGQTRLLSRIFAGSPVMAVGDPHQSIYGWRGASAAGLQSFHADFRGRAAGPAGEREAAATLTLSTSWRNPRTVLDAAAAVSAPLAADSPISVPRLAPSPAAVAGSVEWLFPESVHEEREQLARWVADARAAHLAEHGEPPSAAVIFRNRRHMPAFAAALSAVGVPNRIIGLGGLLSTPEVTDVVSALRCVWYADAGGDLIRLLAGPRFRIGVADLAGLRDAARWFSSRDVGQQRLSEADREADSVLPDPDRQFTLIDALDQIATIRDPSHRALTGISETGIARLREAGRMLANLRQSVGGDIGELISAAVHALRLDIELEANEARDHGGGAAALANLDVFGELVAGYLAVDDRGTLPSLLEWIERAIEADEVDEHVAAPAPGTVQLITAHGSKGLEWDIVAIPRLVEGEFPAAPRRGVGWLRKGQLPDELRGDAPARPQLLWRLASTQKELKDRIADYQAESKERYAEEERRLAYVAITRSAGRLLLSGSFWGGQSRPRQPSPYLLELQEHGVISDLPVASAYDTDPGGAAELTETWPLDPLGARTEPVLRAAAALRAELAADEAQPRAAVDETVRLLLAERAAAERGEGAAVRLPERITASAFHEFVEDPGAAERRRLRPVPQRPFRRTRIGNRFHEWVERRATTALGTALPLFGFDPEEWDPGRAEFDVERELEPLIDVFERSRWAGLRPIAVEQEVTLPFAGRTLVCKLDAVYRSGSGDDARFEVVDWKAGRSPRTDAEREKRFFQLDLYRHAYAQWAGVDPERIDVALFYVAEGVELRGGEAHSLAELERIWREAAARLTG
ncbi:ATP-dependent DNA helicase [Leucobacter ruminantium]